MLYSPHGVIPENYWPAGTETSFTFPAGGILEPLAPYKQDMLIFKGKGTGRTVSPTSVHAEGEALCQTQSTRLARLNGANLRFEGTYNIPTGEFTAKIFTVK